MKCKECNSQLVYFTVGHTCGWKCAHCGWNIVTSNIAAIDTDETRYTISISATSISDASAIKSFAKASGLNVVSAKSALNSGHCFTDSDAKTTYKIAKSLAEYHISYSVAPEFPYDL